MSTTPDDKSGPVPPKASVGNMGPDHWSRARAGENEEALAYYRERSRAPGVAEGGAERNHYCMHCAGVIPFDPAITHCPHCQKEFEGGVKRYFNWVEMNDPPRSDLRALLPWFLLALGLFAAIVFGLLHWLG